MIVHLHTVCWNEAEMLTFFLRHYERWVDHFFILDDGSDDGSRELLESRPDVTVDRLTKANPLSWVDSARRIYDNAWKRSRGVADWVVVTNVDEHLVHPAMTDYLFQMLGQGVTAIPSLGFQMVADALPDPSSLLQHDCPMGAPWRKMGRLAIFRPDKIIETNFAPGRHRAEFAGDFVLPERDEVLNLHYKYIGVDRTYDRQSAQGQRLGSVDRENTWGHQYDWSRTTLGADFARLRERLVDTRDPKIHENYAEHRWWRSARPASRT